jgi:hypothetical protein
MLDYDINEPSRNNKRLVVYEVFDVSKTYNNIKSSQKTLHQRYFRPENQNRFEREDVGISF